MAGVDVKIPLLKWGMGYKLVYKNLVCTFFSSKIHFYAKNIKGGKGSDSALLIYIFYIFKINTNTNINIVEYE
jgi:hypothetical protein